MLLGSVARVRFGFQNKVFYAFFKGLFVCFFGGFFLAYGDALLVVSCTPPALDCGFGTTVELGIAVNDCAEVVELFGTMDAVSVPRGGWSNGWRCVPK